MLNIVRCTGVLVVVKIFKYFDLTLEKSTSGSPMYFINNSLYITHTLVVKRNLFIESIEKMDFRWCVY